METENDQKSVRSMNYRNSSIISFLEPCVKETAIVAFFMVELDFFYIFGPRNDTLFFPLFVLQSGISNTICDLALQLFTEGIIMWFRYDDAIPFQNLKTSVEVHSSTLPSTGGQFIFPKWDDCEMGASKRNMYTYAI